MISFLTGESQIGKTTWLLQLVEQLLGAHGGYHLFPELSQIPEQLPIQNRSQRMPTPQAFGFVTPAVFEDEQKIGINAVLLPSLERFPFAELASKTLASEASHALGPKSHWSFSADAVQKINAHLANVTAENPVEGIFVADELGPLELNSGEGLTEAMRILDEHLFENAIVVIRPSLLDEAIERWGSGCNREYEVIEPGTVPSFLKL